jgi:DNA-binding MarR family transcriptional regulator
MVRNAVPRVASTVEDVAVLLLRWMSASMRRSGGMGVSGSHRVLSRHGTTLPMMVALHVLAFEGSRTMSRIAASLGLSASATSHLLQRLVDLGFVQRHEDPADRRQRLFAITPAGRGAVDELMQARLAELAASVSPLSLATRDRLGHVLRDVVAELADEGAVCSALDPRGSATATRRPGGAPATTTAATQNKKSKKATKKETA